jgi:hypothetical protein
MSSDRLLQKVGFERVFYLNYAGQDVHRLQRKYATLLRK